MPTFLDIWPYRDLILHKAWADFRQESKRTSLGVLWWVLDPVITTGIYFVVFGLIFQRGGADYIPFLTTGIVVWMWFSAAVNASGRSILAHKGFVRQVSFHKVVFPLSRVLMTAYQFVFSLLVLAGVLLLWGFTPQVTWLLLPAILVVELALILGVGLLLAAFIPFVPDIATVTNYLLRLAFFMSCIMYSLDDVGPRLQPLLMFNPMVHIITASREVLMYGNAPDWGPLGIVLGLSVIAALIGAWCIRRFDRVYAKRITA